MSERDSPYLSIVVTTRNDDHGGDPLRRLQIFVNSFDEQCRRTGLDAEVIVVEWNPPADRPRVSEQLCLPQPSFCSYRFIEVPAEIHDRLRCADVLPLFQMIAKNAGIRRARGRFVLATNIDILFSDELVQYLASQPLESGYLYRIDRTDVQAAVPVAAPLTEQMAYCASHQLRIHLTSGSYAVDGSGFPLPMAEDIVDGSVVRLGAGWHVREGTSTTGFWRWAMAHAFVHVELSDDAAPESAVFEIEAQSNPQAPSEWADLEILDESGVVLARHRATRRKIWRLPLDGAGKRRTFELRVVGTSPGNRQELAVFENRDALHYLVRSIRVTSSDGVRRPSFVYPALPWRAEGAAHIELDASEAIRVTTGPQQYAYAAAYGPMTVPASDAYRFELSFDVLEGDVHIGVLDLKSDAWLPALIDDVMTPHGRVATVDVSLDAGMVFELMLSNDHPEGDHLSRFVVKQLTGSIESDQLAGAEPGDEVSAGPTLSYPLEGWQSANTTDVPELQRFETGLAVVSRGPRWSYCIEHGPFRAPVTGVYHFTIDYRPSEGGFVVGLLDSGKRGWLPSSAREHAGDDCRTMIVAAHLRAGQTCWLMLSNDHQPGGVSRFVIQATRGSAEQIQGRPQSGTARIRTVVARLLGVAAKGAARARDFVARPVGRFLTRIRASIVRASPEYAELAASRYALEVELLAARRQFDRERAGTSELRELDHLTRLLKDHRPDPLHLNACGDFQLMAREHWMELRGYPEFQTFSMNIDALFSNIAHYASIRECVLKSPCRIYHLEHEVGSGWTPEGEAALRRRIAERGITWLNSRDVYVWSAYMHWLGRPMIFNQSTWGFGDVELEESTVQPAFSAVRTEG